MDKAMKFIYCGPLNYSCCVTAVRKEYELYKMQNNIMGYVTVENLPRPTTKRKCSSSAIEATPSCHYWKRDMGHNKFTSALSQIKGYQHRDLNLTKPKTVWSEFEVIMDTVLCQNYKTPNLQLRGKYICDNYRRSTLKQGIYDKRCFRGYVLQFSLPFLNLGNTSTATTSLWITSHTSVFRAARLSGM